MGEWLWQSLAVFRGPSINADHRLSAKISIRKAVRPRSTFSVSSPGTEHIESRFDAEFLQHYCAWKDLTKRSFRGPFNLQLHGWFLVALHMNRQGNQSSQAFLLNRKVDVSDTLIRISLNF